MITLILLGNWVNKSEEPDKISLMLLGSNQKGVSYDSKTKYQLRIHFRQLFDKELSKDNIESLTTCNFSSIEDYPNLEQQGFGLAHDIMELLGCDHICALKFEGEVHEEMKKKKPAFKNEFAKGLLFGHRFMHALD